MTRTARAIEVEAGAPAPLHGTLDLVEDAAGIVVFAHGAGSSRHSPRNQAVARAFRERGLSTLLFDLLSVEEERQEEAGGMLRFDMDAMARRLERVVMETKEVAPGPLGLLGSSTGGGAALIVAARLPHHVQAVVSRGGRPDLAGDALQRVPCPVLLVVGGRDPAVLEMNQNAQRRLPEGDLHIIPGATHLFPEPGALDEVARVAGSWFLEHLHPSTQLRSPPRN